MLVAIVIHGENLIHDKLYIKIKTKNLLELQKELFKCSA